MPSSVPAEMPPVDPEAPNDTDTSTPVGSGPRYHVGIAPTFHDAKTKLDGGEEKADYPEGGTRAWLVVLGAWCAMAPAMGFLNTLAILQAWISEHELPEYSDSKLGWIFSCYSFFLYFCGAQIGSDVSLQVLRAQASAPLTNTRILSQVLSSTPTISGSSSSPAP